MRNQFIKPNQPVREPYHYTECGLQNIYLLNGYKVVEYEGERGFAIEDEDELLHEIALTLVYRRPFLSGEEIRFLRKKMDLSQAELAKLMRHDAQTIARWEKGHTKISGAADCLIRIIYLLHTGEEFSEDLIVELTDMDIDCSPPFYFEETDEGWRQPAAA